MHKLKAALFSLCFVSTAVLAAGEIPTPTTLDGGKIVTAQEAKALLDKKDARFVDTRSALNFGKGHIPGAIVVPYKGDSERAAKADLSKDQFDLAKHVPDKNAKVVIYSHGDTGWKSYKAAVKAVQAGYKNVLWMREGYSAWEAKKFPQEL
jgi:rhodanese-related sulfurtransferase